jgi:hypothetical protein
MKRKALLLSAVLAGTAVSLVPAAAHAGLDIGIGTALGRGVYGGVNTRIGHWRRPFGLSLFVDPARVFDKGDRNRDRSRHPVEEIVNRRAGQKNVRLKVSPRESLVYLNGVRVEADGKETITLPPGRHRLEFVAEGRRTEIAELDIQPGIRYDVERKLQKLQKGEQSDLRLSWPEKAVPVAEALKSREAGTPIRTSVESARPAETPAAPSGAGSGD